MNYIVKAQARDMSPVTKTAKTFPNAYLEARMLLSEGEDYVTISEQSSGAVVWDSKSLDMYGDFEHSHLTPKGICPRCSSPEVLCICGLAF